MTQKYIKKDLTGNPCYLADDVAAEEWIDLAQYRLMTEVEILKHETPKPSDFHTDWNGSDWIDPRTEKEKLAYKRSQYPKLTRYQFMRGMLEYGCEAEDIESQILLIEDERTRKLTMIGFKDAGNFIRTDPSIDAMRDMLGKTDLDIDEFWELCMTF